MPSRRGRHSFGLPHDASRQLCNRFLSPCTRPHGVEARVSASAKGGSDRQGLLREWEAHGDGAQNPSVSATVDDTRRARARQRAVMAAIHDKGVPAALRACVRGAVGACKQHCPRLQVDVQRRASHGQLRHKVRARRHCHSAFGARIEARLHSECIIVLAVTESAPVQHIAAAR